MIRLAKLVLLLILVFLLVVLASTSVFAGQFRKFSPILAPEIAPQGFVTANKPKPLQPNLVAEALQRLFDSWNGIELRKHLSKKFYDQSRLLDVIAQDIPRDAKLRVLAIQSVQPLAQFVTTGNQTPQLVQTRVSAIARVQLEWNDLALGFQRLEGTTEYVLDLTTRASNERAQR